MYVPSPVPVGVASPEEEKACWRSISTGGVVAAVAFVAGSAFIGYGFAKTRNTSGTPKELAYGAGALAVMTIVMFTKIRCGISQH